MREGTPPRGMPPAGALLYQPIPFPGFENLPAERDSSEERFRMLVERVGYRNARVLDLGCANGFFLFRLAQTEGALAAGLGIDRVPDNVELSRRIAALHGVDRLRFECAALLDAEASGLVRSERWDVCHLLSVHHHVLREEGPKRCRALIRSLHQQCGVLVVEQGSLTSDEYRDWTGRDEPFSSWSFSRLVSMLEACGIPQEECSVVGLGMYRSGLRPDATGVGRAIVAAGTGNRPGRIRQIHRKRHRNGIFMEVVETAAFGGHAGEVWKQSVAGGTLATREARALELLGTHRGFPRLLDPAAAAVDASHGLLRMERIELAEMPVSAGDLAGESLRAQFVDRLLSMARSGVVHNELSAEHVVLDTEGTLVVLDLETAWFRDEPRERWLAEVYAPNPVLGLGAYPRELHETSEGSDADLRAADGLLLRWGQPRLTEEEKEKYRRLFRAG